MSLVAVASATVPTLNIDVPVGLLVKKSNSPAVAVHTRLIPWNLDLPANITSAAEALMPAETLPAGFPQP